MENPRHMKGIKFFAVLMALGLATSRFAAAADKDSSPAAATVMNTNLVSVRYMIDDVNAAAEFYTKHFGFTMEVDSAPAFASVVRGNLRLLLSGRKSSGRRPMLDGTKTEAGGWNRIVLQVPDIEKEAARLHAAGVKFRRDDIVTGPGGAQIWVMDPSGNLVELFQYKQ